MNLLRYASLLAIISSCLFASQTSFASSLTPDEALLEMRQGNARFVSGRPIHPNSSKARITETSTGQNPFVTLITCSDSRVPVGRVFDQGIGDVFVIRVAGNVCDTDEIGSIEYGVDHLGTPLMVVLGHTGCGAVTAVATGAEVHGSIPALVDNIGPAVKRAEKNTGLKGSALVPAAVKENVWQSISDLLTGSPGTANLVREHQLMVVGAVYDISDGSVEWMGEHPGQASLLASANSASHGGGDPHGEEIDSSDGGHEAEHAADSAAGHEVEGEQGSVSDAATKALIAKNLSAVNTALMLIAIGMCVLGLGLGLVAYQIMQLKMPAAPPKKKKAKPAKSKPVEDADADSGGEE